jgi:hypothetical protein
MRVFLVVLLAVFSGTLSAAGLTGPITGGEHGTPFSAVDVSDQGYVTEEYFLDGDASAYELTTGTHSADGNWKTAPSKDTAAFRTRFLVVRPASTEQFNGTVVVFWQNVTAGYELGSASGESLRGYAWVGVSAQKVGIDGFPAPRPPSGLKVWDEKRYGSLNHPGDGYSYDIFTQVARAVDSDRDQSFLDPMGGLDVKRVIAVGASQSAARLRTYINGVHHHAKVFDGYIPFIDFGSVVAFKADRDGTRGGGRGIKIRSDLDVPVIVVNSETETLPYYPARQPDSATFRLWEVPGTSHVSVPRKNDHQVDESNWMSFAPVYSASIRHLQNWLVSGTEPPKMPRVRVEDSADENGQPRIVRDRHGNAMGGVRLPDIKVPTASHSGMGKRREGMLMSFLYGNASDFDTEKRKSLYPTSEAYLSAWNEALATSVAEGMVLPEDAPRLREQSANWAAVQTW